MFRLHDRTRRWICRTLFLALCLAPTGGVLAWSVSLGLTGYQTAVEAEISRALGGLQVRVTSVAHPRPAMMLLSDLAISDPETGATIFTARSVEVGTHAQGTSLRLGQAELQTEQLPSCFAALRERLRQPAAALTPLLVLPCELTLRSATSAQTLTDLQARLQAGAKGPQADIRFRVAGVEMPEAAQIRLIRNRRDGAPVTNFELHTAGSSLPCSLLASAVGMENRFGDGCQFEGFVAAAEGAEGWQVDGCFGHLTGVDLRALVSDQFPHLLTGNADVTLDSARFEQGRLQQAAGSVRAGPGRVGTPLLRAAAESLGVRLVPERLQAEAVGYDQLALQFEVNASGLSLAGQCDASTSGTILTGPTGSLVHEPIAPQSTLGLVQMLVPRTELLVPATRQTDWLLRLLPIPDLRSPAGAPPRGRLGIMRRVEPEAPATPELR